MKIHTFIADSAPEAVAQIRAQLGPDAVVLNVRKIQADGLQKIWKKPQIEVLAHVPEPVVEKPNPLDALTDLRREIADLRQHLPAKRPEPVLLEEERPKSSVQSYGAWKVGLLLEQAGVMPRQIERILETVESEHGAVPPESIAKEFDLVRGAIAKLVGAAGASGPLRTTGSTHSTHIFVGPPGSGKTTVLSKILAQRVLIENEPARVLRLDGARANTAESLSIYCEILGVNCDRCLTEESRPQPGESCFIDLPGTPIAEPEALKQLAAHLAQFPGAQIHLTLNAAYETSTLLAQLRAFSFLPITDVVFTHLDEETRWGKLLNFAFGTKFPLTLLSAGQNVPGNLFPNAVEKIVSRVIPSK